METSISQNRKKFSPKRPNRQKTTELALYGLFTALIIAGTFIKIPIPLVPITMQFVFVNMSSLLLGRKGAFPVALYVFLGLCGVPVFTSGGGFGYVLLPSFGYLIGFIIGAFAAGCVIDKAKINIKTMLLASLINILIIYIAGLSYVYFITNYYTPGASITVKNLILTIMLRTIPGDMLWIIVSSVVCVKLSKILRNKILKKDKPSIINTMKEKILAGDRISKQDAMRLVDVPLEELCRAADEIREKVCGNTFDMCSIINGKSGGCTENCKFCAQSKHHKTHIEELNPPDCDVVVSEAVHNYNKGVLRFSIVTAGRALSDSEVDDMCEKYQQIGQACDIFRCASHGLLTYEQLKKLKDAGVRRYHNNLEVSRRYFPNMCTTHTYDDKINTIKAALAAGLEVCSGGIMGIGETMEDRIDMALDLREIGVRSIPVNIINPIPGTPYMNTVPLSESEVRRIVAIFRFVIPDAMIRMAGGRGLLNDKGASVFKSGANAAATGDMLTTAGISIENDMEIVKNLGFEVRLK